MADTFLVKVMTLTISSLSEMDLNSKAFTVATISSPERSMEVCVFVQMLCFFLLCAQYCILH